jgi:hypothetical protein
MAASPAAHHHIRFEAASARADAIFGAIGGNAGLVPGSSPAPGSSADCSSINPGGLRRLHSNWVTPRGTQPGTGVPATVNDARIIEL